MHVVPSRGVYPKHGGGVRTANVQRQPGQAPATVAATGSVCLWCILPYRGSHRPRNQTEPSVVLPHIVAALVAVAGLVVTVVSYLYIFGSVEGESGELVRSARVGAVAIPAVGATLAAFAFLVMFVLLLIPTANRR